MKTTIESRLTRLEGDLRRVAGAIDTETRFSSDWALTCAHALRNLARETQDALDQYKREHKATVKL